MECKDRGLSLQDITELFLLKMFWGIAWNKTQFRKPKIYIEIIQGNQLVDQHERTMPACIN